MADYGVLPEGFNRKPLAVILSELELGHISEFGPQVIQTAQSPLGQINGVMADVVSQIWEIIEDVYQSYDPDQAEGSRLASLAKIRLLTKGVGESEIAFRRAVTNEGQARVDLQDFSHALANNVDGVTFAHVWVNDDSEMDENFMPANSICAAVTGGDDSEIAAIVRKYVVPGITTTGNTTVSTVLEGYCRSVRILRPVAVPVTLEIGIRFVKDPTGCPPPNPSVVEAYLLENIFLLNGEAVTYYKVRSIIEANFPSVEVVYINGSRDSTPQAQNEPIPVAFTERAMLTADSVTIEVL